MSADELPPYEPWMQELLEQERTLPPLPPELEHRLLSRLAVSPGAAAGATLVGAKLSTLVAGMLGLAAGAAIGAAGYATFGPVKERVVTRIEVRERLVPTPVLELDAGQREAPAEVAETPHDAGSRAVRARPRPRSQPTPQRDQDLAEENALITRAQNALARGQADQSLEATREHQRLYPRGRFVEEREALAIQALSRLGRRAEAHTRAQRFYRAYPASLLTRLVRAAVAEQP